MKEEMSQEDLQNLKENLDSKKSNFSYIKERLKGRNKIKDEKQEKGEDTYHLNGPSYNTSPMKKAEDFYFAAQSEDSKRPEERKAFENYDKADFEEAIVYELKNIGETGRKNIKRSSKDERPKIISGLQDELKKTEELLSNKELQDYFNVSQDEVQGYMETLRGRAYEAANNVVKNSETYEDMKAGKQLLNYIEKSENLSPSKEKSGGLEKKIAGIFSLIAFGLGAVFSYKGITGNVISQTTSTLSGIGAFLVIIGVVLGSFALKQK